MGLKFRKWSMVLVVSVAVGMLVLFRREAPTPGFEERVLVARRDLKPGTRIDLADFEAHPISRISPLPRPGAAVNDQQLHLLGGLRAQARIPRSGLLLWSELEADRPEPKRRLRQPSIEIIEEQ